MKCWGWIFHDWKCVRIYHDYNGLWKGYHGAPRTLAAYVCCKCGTAKTKQYTGAFLTVAELNAFRSEIDKINQELADWTNSKSGE